MKRLAMPSSGRVFVRTRLHRYMGPGRMAHESSPRWSRTFAGGQPLWMGGTGSMWSPQGQGLPLRLMPTRWHITASRRSISKRASLPVEQAEASEYSKVSPARPGEALRARPRFWGSTPRATGTGLTYSRRRCQASTSTSASPSACRGRVAAAWHRRPQAGGCDLQAPSCNGPSTS